MSFGDDLRDRYERTERGQGMTIELPPDVAGVVRDFCKRLGLPPESVVKVGLVALIARLGLETREPPGRGAA